MQRMNFIYNHQTRIYWNSPYYWKWAVYVYKSEKGDEWHTTNFHYFIESQASIDELNCQQNSKIRIIFNGDLNYSCDPYHYRHWCPKLLKKKVPLWRFSVLKFISAMNLEKDSRFIWCQALWYGDMSFHIWAPLFNHRVCMVAGYRHI